MDSGPAFERQTDDGRVFTRFGPVWSSIIRAGWAGWRWCASSDDPAYPRIYSGFAWRRPTAILRADAARLAILRELDIDWLEHPAPRHLWLEP